MAGEGDAERLVVLLEARTNDALKAMDRAEKKFDKAYGQMRKGSRTATQQMEADMNRTTGRINQAMAATSTKIGQFGKAMAAGFVGGLVAGGISGIVSRLGQVASGIAEIGDEAKRAGIDVKSFQELKYVAEQNRISVDALTDGMKELSLRADEWIVTGGGAGAEAFQRLGYSAEELNTKLQNPSALLSEIIGKVQGLDRAAQIRIFDELFGGTGGEQFVQIISQGEEGIRRTIDEANNLGIVMDAQLIAKAAEVDRKFNMVANTVGTAVKGAIVEAASALNDFLNSLGQTPAQHFAEIEGRLQGLRAEIDEYLAAAGRVVPELEPGIRQIIKALDDETMSTEEAKAALQELGAQNLEAFPITAGLNGVIALMEHLTGKAQEAAAAVAAASSDPVEGGGPAATWENVQNMFFPKPRTVPGSGAGGGGGGRDKAAEEAERQAKAVQNLIAGLEFERSLIGLSAVEQQKMTALRQAGAAATDEQRMQIERLVTETYNEQMRVDQLQATFDMLGQVGQSAIQGIIGSLEDGKISAEEFGGILSNVLSMAANYFLGNAFNSLGSIFTGGAGGAGGVTMNIEIRSAS